MWLSDRDSGFNPGTPPPKKTPRLTPSGEEKLIDVMHEVSAWLELAQGRPQREKFILNSPLHLEEYLAVLNIPATVKMGLCLLHGHHKLAGGRGLLCKYKCAFCIVGISMVAPVS